MLDRDWLQFYRNLLILDNLWLRCCNFRFYINFLVLLIDFLFILNTFLLIFYYLMLIKLCSFQEITWLFRRRSKLINIINSITMNLSHFINWCLSTKSRLIIFWLRIFRLFNLNKLTLVHSTKSFIIFY